MEFEPGAGVVERGGVDPAYPLPPPRFARHEAGALEHAEMFRHRGEGKRKRLGEMADGRFPRDQAIKDGPAGGIGQRPEDAIEVLFNHMVECIDVLPDIQPFSKI